MGAWSNEVRVEARGPGGTSGETQITASDALVGFAIVLGVLWAMGSAGRRLAGVR